MKSIKSLLLLGAFGLFAASCGQNTESETATQDTVVTEPVAPVDTVAGGSMDAATTTGGTTDTTVTADTTHAAH